MPIEYHYHFTLLAAKMWRALLFSRESEIAGQGASYERLVRSSLYNWIGYGNVNASVWFLGVEEGGAEIWRHRTKTLEQSLEIRSKFHLQMDFRHVWEDLYNIPLSSWTGPNVWRYIAAFILEFEGRDATVENINDYIFYAKQLGRESSNHFLGEMMPLPKPSKKSIKPYESIWSSVNDYYDEVGPKCGVVLIVRKGKYRTFKGCNNYPKCKFTQSIG